MQIINLLNLCFIIYLELMIFFLKFLFSEILRLIHPEFTEELSMTLFLYSHALEL
jgi:hypothetical protein